VLELCVSIFLQRAPPPHAIKSPRTSPTIAASIAPMFPAAKPRPFFLDNSRSLPEHRLQGLQLLHTPTSPSDASSPSPMHSVPRQVLRRRVLVSDRRPPKHSVLPLLHLQCRWTHP
jgi:hypothetical protein